MSSQPLLGRRNLQNLVLLILVPVPAVVATHWLFTYFDPNSIPADPGHGGLTSVDAWVAHLLHHPIVSVNIIFFFNVCLLFWLASLVQRSTWLIDPYWTLIPLFIAWFYRAHPLANATPLRADLVLLVLLVWSIRLTHNYLRREQWRLGFREDWRFAETRRASPHFWWYQFFYVYLAQQVMLVGLTLPFWAVAFRTRPFCAWDVLFGLLALLGIGIAHKADSELHSFMRSNEERAARGEPKLRLLDSGIWRYSRHPNYFGEQLFWWAVACWGLLLGEPWVMLGTVINSLVLAAVTMMSERRMAAVPERAEIYRAYQRRTSILFPWFRRES